jgi:hypothetical protein
MGMDINGRKPTGERGEYFRNNVWWWRPLADYCITVAPDICAACRYWHSNDGDGLDAAGAFALAEALQKEIDAGRTETYARRYASEQELMPNEPCGICAGTGVRTPFVGNGAARARCDRRQATRDLHVRNVPTKNRCHYVAPDGLATLPLPGGTD